MKGKPKTIQLKQLASGILMFFLLGWLTVCLPYVNESQQAADYLVENTADPSPDNDSCNPLANTNEEKTESSTSLLSEYLHDPFQIVHSFTNVFSYFKCHSSDLYLAYHPELVIPPPEA